MSIEAKKKQLELLKRQKRSLQREIDLQKKTDFVYFDKKVEREHLLRKKDLIKNLVSKKVSLSIKISKIEEEIFKERTKKSNLNKLLRSKRIRNNLVSIKSYNLAKKTSFYYAFRRNYLFNPYKSQEVFNKRINNLVRSTLLGRFLNRFGAIRDIERKNPMLNKIKSTLNNSNIKQMMNPRSSVSLSISNVLNRSIEKWFPGKFGSTARLIKAWITRKMLYGESGFSKFSGSIVRQSFGGYKRVPKLGVTFSRTDYLSRRRKIRTIKRGFRKGGGYRRFA
jgi:hypothetical protein